MEVAVIKTGGKQYVVSKGDTIYIEKLPGDLKKGDMVVFNEVLLVDNGKDTTIGAPTIKGAEVKGTVAAVGQRHGETEKGTQLINPEAPTISYVPFCPSRSEAESDGSYRR